MAHERVSVRVCASMHTRCTQRVCTTTSNFGAVLDSLMNIPLIVIFNHGMEWVCPGGACGCHDTIVSKSTFFRHQQMAHDFRESASDHSHEHESIASAEFKSVHIDDDASASAAVEESDGSVSNGSDMDIEEGIDRQVGGANSCCVFALKCGCGCMCRCRCRCQRRPLPMQNSKGRCARCSFLRGT